VIKIGIIGAGANAGGHARYFSSSPRSEVVFVADPALERAQQLAQEIWRTGCRDYQTVLAEADAVVVCSPNFLHHEQAIAVARAGRHVYCEKPMGLSATQAREIANAVNEAGVKSQVGFSVRFDPSIQTMVRYAQEGELGQIVSLCSRRLCYMNPEKAPAWRRDHELSGGLLMEINIHELEWMMYIGGEVESVYARSWAANPASERSNDHIWVTLNFAQGATGIHEGSWLSSTSAYYRNVQGTQGGMSTDEWGTHLYYAHLDEDRVTITPDEAFDLRGNFLDSIEGVAEATADVNYALKVMTVAEAVLQSAASNRVVSLQELNAS
jgi:predicted dehydrogenase